MPRHERVSVSGVITDIFAHRFVLETTEGKLLADLTPEGAKRIDLQPGARVTISGEQKPSEIKVESFTREGGETELVDARHSHEHGSDADPSVAALAAEAAGYTVLGKPRGKPKHFEVLGRSGDGSLHELHIEFDGKLRKAKDADRQKWAGELASAG